MSNKRIISILQLHYIPYYIDENEHIKADSMESDTAVFEHVIDVTGWTQKRLLDWLGY